MDDHDLIDIDPDEAGKLLDWCITRLDELRAEILRVRRIKAAAEQVIPLSPVEELIAIAEGAFNDDSSR